MVVTAESRPKNRPEKAADSAWADRLGKVADDIDAHHDFVEDALQLRDQLIVRAIDAGWPGGQVALWARVSRTRVNQILARPPEG